MHPLGNQLFFEKTAFWGGASNNNSFCTTHRKFPIIFLAVFPNINFLYWFLVCFNAFLMVLAAQRSRTGCFEPRRAVIKRRRRKFCKIRVKISLFTIFFYIFCSPSATKKFPVPLHRGYAWRRTPQYPPCSPSGTFRTPCGDTMCRTPTMWGGVLNAMPPP